MPKTALVIMARYPELGKTKTRLARTLGEEATLEIYQAFLKDLAQRFAVPEYALNWAYFPPYADFASYCTTLVPEEARHMRTIPQQGGDLGERLRYVFEWTRDQGFQQTIVMSSDSPHIERDVVDKAIQALERTDMVLGPAEDGGYYLLGLHEPYDVFSGIPMSTNVVAEMTIAAARRYGLSYQLLETLQDVDEVADLVQLTRLLESEPSLAPATAACLERLKSRVLPCKNLCAHACPSRRDAREAMPTQRTGN
ncbi:TIGR04282 family arsenosugar biosynthesis glycosyltransferase [Ktedonospora formicarum]|uniref:Glycosyltransferase n=1 Tax=Ktedonospora formicarum TaxID=2778364 RepID=A0A8J3MQ68_9CHLR|nr:TIGR04282 family arsenosugar biosynthesis glycosyltransferase [Ktedonospora formicarum]GHO42313.1 hypothetical protein KSX_04760 [Ktedonospora formicarum]